MGPLLLFIVTFIWGTAFLAQKVGDDALGPFALTCLRSVLGALFLAVCLLVRRARGGARMPGAPSVRAGVLCGVPLFAAMLTQQIGIRYTSPGVSAFLTTNYVLFVPLIVCALTRRLPGLRILLGAAASLGGTYLICMPGNAFHLGRGEAWTILCALLFAVQMLTVDRFARRSDLLVMSAFQLVTVAVLAAPFMLLPEEAGRLGSYCSVLAHGSARAVWKAAFPVLYIGIGSSGIAYTLQNYGQARTPPALAAIICSMESVFGALSGYFVLGDVLSTLQFAGCALVLAAVIVSQLPATRP